MTTLVEAALAWWDAGASVLPAGRGKQPALPWKEYQDRRMGRDELAEMLTGLSYDGIGLVTGYGGYEMFEIEGRAADRLIHLLAALPEELAAKLTTYMERSPKGGFHFIYVCEGEQEGSTKLARMPDPSAAAGWSVTIETRGKPGWTVLAPSGGNVHDEIPGGRWEIAHGVPGVVPVLTEEEREALFDAARELDEMPPPPVVEHRPASAAALGDDDLMPGQDYERRTDWMADILGPLGWTVVGHEGEKTILRRPGKRTGKSATLNYDGNDNLYVFTSSTDFPELSSWTKFGAYAFLNHGNDWGAAAKELRRQGYGSPPKIEKHDITDLIPPAGEEPSSPVASPKAAPNDGPAITLTDDGSVRLLVAQEGHRLRYCPERTDWLEWDGTRWREGGEAAAVQAFIGVVHSIQPRNDAERKYQERSLDARVIFRVIKLARTHPALVVHAKDLDAMPYELNAPNGVADLITGEVRTPTPCRLHTRLTGVPIDFAMITPRWLAFLRETFGDDEDLIEFVQRLAGYAATGQVTHHVLPFLYGNGANGKSVFMEVLLAVLGDYAGTVPADFLLAGAHVHETVVANLQGKRLVVCSEVGPTAKFHEQRIKQYTGGDVLQGRWLYGKPFDFEPTHTMALMGNHQPKVDAGGESFWRRVRLVPFLRTVPVEKRIPGLARQLVAEEGPGILAWIVKGAMKQAIDGLREPESVAAATSQYEEEEDHLGRFIEERVRFGGGTHVRVSTADMRHAYEQWCFAEGEQAIQPHVFGRELKARGAVPVKAGGKRAYSNVTLMRAEDEVSERPEQLRWGQQ